MPQVNIDFDIVAASLGLLSLLSFIYYKVIKPRNELINTAIKNSERWDQDSIQLRLIAQQLFPNGGSSAIDSLNRIEGALINVMQKQHVYLLEHDLGIFETNTEGKCISVNKTYCRITGRTESECTGTGWVHIIHPEDRSKVIDEWNLCVNGVRDFKMHYRMQTPKGKAIHVYCSAHPMVHPYKKDLLGYLGTIKLVLPEKITKKNQNDIDI